MLGGGWTRQQIFNYTSNPRSVPFIWRLSPNGALQWQGDLPTNSTVPLFAADAAIAGSIIYVAMGSPNETILMGIFSDNGTNARSFDGDFGHISSPAGAVARLEFAPQAGLLVASMKFEMSSQFYNIPAYVSLPVGPAPGQSLVAFPPVFPPVFSTTSISLVNNSTTLLIAGSAHIARDATGPLSAGLVSQIDAKTGGPVTSFGGAGGFFLDLNSTAPVSSHSLQSALILADGSLVTLYVATRGVQNFLYAERRFVNSTAPDTIFLIDSVSTAKMLQLSTGTIFVAATLANGQSWMMGISFPGAPNTTWPAPATYPVPGGTAIGSIFGIVEGPQSVYVLFNIVEGAATRLFTQLCSVSKDGSLPVYSGFTSGNSTYGTASILHPTNPLFVSYSFAVVPDQPQFLYLAGVTGNFTGYAMFVARVMSQTGILDSSWGKGGVAEMYNPPGFSSLVSGLFWNAQRRRLVGVGSQRGPLSSGLVSYFTIDPVTAQFDCAFNAPGGLRRRWPLREGISGVAAGSDAFYVVVGSSQPAVYRFGYELLDSCNPICGDGVIEGSETCDDGNSSNGDGCSATCQVESGWVCRTPNVLCAQ